MNSIQAKQITSFGRNILSIFIDDKPLSEMISSKSGISSLKDLWCSLLLKKNNEPWEQHGNYIWELVEDKQNCNLPIMLCPDDMDFWCTIIVVKVCFCNDIVFWDKIGLVTGEINIEQWRRSGIQNIDKWSEHDWELYGGTLSYLSAYDKTWDSWCSEHWIDEEKRRLWNYYHPFLNDEKNIKWLDCDSLTFNSYDYDACVSAFKDYVY